MTAILDAGMIEPETSPSAIPWTNGQTGGAIAETKG
jgi:hypothetical protein